MLSEETMKKIGLKLDSDRWFGVLNPRSCNLFADLGELVVVSADRTGRLSVHNFELSGELSFVSVNFDAKNGFERSVYHWVDFSDFGSRENASPMRLVSYGKFLFPFDSNKIIHVAPEMVFLNPTENDFRNGMNLRLIPVPENVQAYYATAGEEIPFEVMMALQLWSILSS